MKAVHPPFFREVLPAVHLLSQLNFKKSLSALISDWVIVASTTTFALQTSSLLIDIISIFIIASRQHALFILMHEGAHQRLSKNSTLNEFLSDFFAAYPLFIKTNGYRLNHLAHHKYLNTDSDPDWVRKGKSPDWTFPKEKEKFGWLLFRNLVGFGIIEMFMTVIVLSDIRFTDFLKNIRKTYLTHLLRLSYYSILALTVTGFDLWIEFVCFWLVPYFVLLPLFNRVRSIAEHFGLKNEHSLNQSRNVRGSRLQNFFFGPHQVNFHLDHHLFPSVPFYNLPELNKVLQTHKSYREQGHFTTQYVGKNSVVSEVTKP